MLIKIRICILIYHFSIRWFPVFLETWNFIILRKDSGKKIGPENLPHVWWSRQLKLADSSGETLKRKPYVTVNEPSPFNCSYEQRWTGHKAIRNQSIKMNMLFFYVSFYAVWYIHVWCLAIYVNEKKRTLVTYVVAAIPFAIGLNIDILFSIVHNIQLWR